MWCYKKPGFESLLLAELQRQQQCNQFCDTLLKTDGLAVPAHSCILSAISPQIFSSLSSVPPAHAGRSHFLEFQALGSSTLLQLVRLLYSGQMAGEGEEERQEAVSAAARLGIHGLVEVTKGGNEAAEGQHKEVGVQTETVIPEENEEGQGRWRREERDGDTFLWREKMSQGEKDTWTQTEVPQVNTAPPYQAATYETIDLGALQTLGQTEPDLHQTQIPYIPVSLVYPPNCNQNQVTPCADPKSWWAGSANEEIEEEQLEQFQGNIPEYINYFLNPHKKEGRRRGRPRGSRGTRARAASGVRGPRRQRASSGGRGRGRGRGGLTQTVDVQTVGVSKIQKMFLERWEIRTPRTGQGGGAVGRKLHLKTRELLKQTKNCPRRRRRCGKEWELSQIAGVKGGEDNLQQDGFPAQRGMNKPTPTSFSSPSVRFYNPHLPHLALSASSSALQPSPSPSLMSPAPSYQLPASSLIHTNPLPPSNLPPHEPEHFDRLLEEVMIGLNILPNQTKHQDHTTLILETGPRHVGDGGSSGGCGPSGSSVPVLQQQGEGEVNEILENFLQSFEKHVESCSTREEMEKNDQICAETVLNKYRETRRDKTGSLQSCLQLHTSPVFMGPVEETKTPEKAPPTRKRRRRNRNQFQFPMERKRVRRRKPVSSRQAKDKTDKQLLQMPVVKLERNGPLPERVTLQGRHCQSLEKCSALTNRSPGSPSSQKFPQGGWERKMYPIRSRFKEAQITDCLPFLHDPPPDEQHPTTGNPDLRQGSLKKNQQLGSLCNGENSLSPIQHQQHLAVCKHIEGNHENRGDEFNIQTNESLRRTKKKRRVEVDEEKSSDDTEPKRLCCEKSTHRTYSASAASAPTGRDDVHSSVRDGSQKEKCAEKLTWREESLEEEEINVDEDIEDCHQAKIESISVSPPSPLSCEDDVDEDVDVIGGSSPVPDPVIICWSDSSGGEEREGDQDVDVVGGKMDHAPSALLTSR